MQPAPRETTEASLTSVVLFVSRKAGKGSTRCAPHGVAEDENPWQSTRQTIGVAGSRQSELVRKTTPRARKTEAFFGILRPQMGKLVDYISCRDKTRRSHSLGHCDRVAYPAVVG